MLAGRLGGVPFKYFGDWTDRIAKGELPHSKPTRPQGVERNVVVTTWDWGDPKNYLHDLIASRPAQSDGQRLRPALRLARILHRRNPDPRSQDATRSPPSRRRCAMPNMPKCSDPGTPRCAEPLAPSAYWGDEKIWDTKANNHNSMFDKKGRVWFAATVARSEETRPSARRAPTIRRPRLFPLERAHRQLTMLDPKTRSTPSSTPASGPTICSSATTPTTPCGPAAAARCVGWINTKMFDETGDAAKSQGWTRAHPRHQRQRQARRLRRARTSRSIRPRTSASRAGFYAVMPSPVDGSIWGTSLRQPRLDRAARARPQPARDRAGGNLQRARAGLRHPRRRHRQATASCGSRSPAATSAASTGASARARSTGRRRPAIIARRAGRSTSTRVPASRASGENSAESSYYTWVDQHNTFGLGKDVPMSHRQPHGRRWSRSRTARWSRCASRIRSASTPRASTAASTIRMPAGKAAACGRRAATARRG